MRWGKKGEIESALKKLKNNRCAGIDKVVCESLKYGSKSTGLLVQLQIMFENIWKTNLVPHQWKHAVITTIYKKGAMTDAKNYRAIAISATLGRLLPMIILKRLESSYNSLIDQSQCGFVSGKSCDDALWTLQNLCKKKNEKFYHRR